MWFTTVSLLLFVSAVVAFFFSLCNYGYIYPTLCDSNVLIRSKRLINQEYCALQNS